MWSLITSNVKSMLLLCSKLVELQLSTNGCTLVLLNHFLFILLVFISFFVLVLRYCVVPSSRFRKVLYLEVFLSLQGKLWNLVLAFLIVSMAVSQFLWGLLGFVESNLFTRQSPLMLSWKPTISHSTCTPDIVCILLETWIAMDQHKELVQGPPKPAT